MCSALKHLRGNWLCPLTKGKGGASREHGAWCTGSGRFVKRMQTALWSPGTISKRGEFRAVKASNWSSWSSRLTCLGSCSSSQLHWSRSEVRVCLRCDKKPRAPVSDPVSADVGLQDLGCRHKNSSADVWVQAGAWSLRPSSGQDFRAWTPARA